LFHAPQQNAWRSAVQMVTCFSANTQLTAVVFANIIRVPVRGIGLHLDDPDGFVTAISNAQVTAHASDA
jgi:hypothetical protein